MAQFDVYHFRGDELAVDVQTDLLGHFDSRIVVPLMPRGEAPVVHPRLNPALEIDGRTYIMVTQFMIATHRAELGKPMGNLLYRYDAIKAALDMIFLGF